MRFLMHKHESEMSTLALDGKQIGYVKIERNDFRLSTYAEVIELASDEYQIQPIDPEYYEQLKLAGVNKPNNLDKVKAIVNGQEYEGAVLKVKGKYVYIYGKESRMNKSSSYTDLLEQAFEQMSLTTNATKPGQTDAEKSKGTDAEKSSHHTKPVEHKSVSQESNKQNIETFSISMTTTARAGQTSEEIEQAMEEKKRLHLKKLDEGHKKELEMMKNNPHSNFSNTASYTGLRFSANIDLERLVKKMRDKENKAEFDSTSTDTPQNSGNF